MSFQALARAWNVAGTIPPHAFLAYLKIANDADTDGFAQVDSAEIAAWSGMSVIEAKAAIDMLCRASLIRREGPPERPWFVDPAGR